MSRPRSGGRAPDELRPTTIEPGFVRTATGSALISCGETRVICTASVQDSVPRWMIGKGRGWVTAEYGMLPASTGDRKQRDVTKGRPDGRTVEIQRLIGRSLRGIVDFQALGERTIYVDCDVLQADGGTRCAAITGGYVALDLACRKLVADGLLERSPLTGTVAAVSCGVIDGVPMLDLDYPEDSSAEVDANVVMTGEGGLVEVQATAERTPLSRAHLDDLLALAQHGHRGPARDPGRRRLLKARAVRLLLATRNAHKLREFRRLLPAVALDPLPDGLPSPVEDGDTYAANALIKARAAAAATGRAAIADDSGIEAAALGGAPGVATARYAGEHATDAENLAKLVAAAPAGSAPAVRVRDRPRRARRRRAPVRGHRDGDRGGAAARRGRLRLRPAVRPRRRPGRRPHDGRAVGRRQGRDLPSRPRGARARGVAAAMRGQRSRAAAVSIVSNTALIALKLVAGLVTGSVAIITEAIHSSVDLAASYIAFFSVRQAETPADASHRYGHEKFENVAAAAEGVLILVGSGVIVYAAIRSLIEGPELELARLRHRRRGLRHRRQPRGLRVAVQAGARDAVGGAGGRRGAPAHRRVHVARRAGRPRARAVHGRRVARPGRRDRDRRARSW